MKKRKAKKKSKKTKSKAVRRRVRKSSKKPLVAKRRRRRAAAATKRKQVVKRPKSKRARPRRAGNKTRSAVRYMVALYAPAVSKGKYFFYSGGIGSKSAIGDRNQAAHFGSLNAANATVRMLIKVPRVKKAGVFKASDTPQKIEQAFNSPVKKTKKRKKH